MSRLHRGPSGNRWGGDTVTVLTLLSDSPPCSSVLVSDSLSREEGLVLMVTVGGVWCCGWVWGGSWAGLAEAAGISLLGVTWKRPTVTVGFFSSEIGDSLFLAAFAPDSDTTRGEEVRSLGEDTVLCGLAGVEEEGELVIEVEAELSVCSWNPTLGPSWQYIWGLTLDPGGERLEPTCLKAVPSTSPPGWGDPGATLAFNRPCWCRAWVSAYCWHMSRYWPAVIWPWGW